MSNRLLRTLNPSRKLQRLALISILLLMPIGAWAEDYPILVGNTRLTDANIGNYPISWNKSTSMPTITLSNANLTETITWDGPKSTYGGQLLIVLEGVNKISTGDQFCLIEERDKTGSGAGYELTFVAADDDSELTMECNKIGSDVRTIDGFYNMTNPNLIDLHQTLTSTSGKYTMKLVKYYGLIIAKVPVTKDNVSSKITGDHISGDVSFDKDNNTLTLEGAELTWGICWQNGESGNPSTLTISLKGNNSISLSEDGACIYSTATTTTPDHARALTRGTSYNSYISFQKDPSSTDLCSLLLKDKGGINVINDFANSASPTMGTGLKWVVKEKDNANYITEAYIAEPFNITVAGTEVNSINANDVLNDGGTISFEPASSSNSNVNTLTLNGASFNGTVESELGNLTVLIKGSNTIAYTGNSPVFESTQATASLTFTKEGSDPTLKISNQYSAGKQDPLIKGFSSIEYTTGGLSLISPMPVRYTAADGLKPAYNQSDFCGNVTFTTATVYPLWIAGTQVTAKNMGKIFADANVTFTPGSGSNKAKLEISNAPIAGHIISGVGDLEVYFSGTSTITGSDSAAVIRSMESNATLTFTAGNATASLELVGRDDAVAVVRGFQSIVLGDGVYQETKEPTAYSTKTVGNYFGYDDGCNKGLVSAVKDNINGYYPVRYLKLSTSQTYPLWIRNADRYIQVTEDNKGDVWKTKSSNPEVTFAPTTNTLTLNAVTLDNCPSSAIYSGLGDLIINLQDENYFKATNDTISLIRSGNGGKLTITKTGTTASLLLQNKYSDSYPELHLPVIKDFDSFELADGLYISNTRTGYYGVGNPTVYGSYSHSIFSGKGLIDPTYQPGDQQRGTCQVKISTDVNYPIWIAYDRQTVGAGYNTLYRQITPNNKSDVLQDATPTVSFTPASADNENVNTLKLTRAEIQDGIVSNLKNLTIEFSEVNKIGKDNNSSGYIRNYDPSAVLTFKALTENGQITLNAGTDPAVEGFANVAFIDATDGSATYDTSSRSYSSSIVTISANPTDYGVKVGGKSVNNLNYTNVFGDGKVSFELASSSNNNVNKLTLDGATITTEGIESSLDNLTIHLEGTNKISGAVASISNGIKSNNENGKLTFTANGNASLDIKTSSKAISGFANVVFSDNTYLACSVPTQYNANQKTYLNQQGQNSNDLAASATKDLTITTTATYPLWIGQPGYLYIQQNTNTLSLNNADLTDRFIVSGLSNLTITLEGTSKIASPDTLCCIRSFNSDATLTFQKKDGATDCELSLSKTMVVKGFKSVSHDGLNFASKTGSKIDDASTKDAILTTATIYPLWVGATLVTENNTSGTDGASGTWSYNAGSNTLTLTGYTKTDNNGHAFISNMANLNIFLDGTNIVSPGSGVTGTKAFYTTYTDATLTFSTDDSNKGTLDASGFNTLCEGFRTDNGIYCNNGLGYFPDDRKIEAKKTPNISFYKRQQTGDNAPGHLINAVVGGTETLTTTYGSTFYAPKPTFENGYKLDNDVDSIRYTYSYIENGIVEFPVNSTNATTGKITYGEINLLKAGTVTITCSFPGNMQNNPCSASYTLKVDKANATFDYNVVESYGYIDVDGNGQWGTPGTTGGAAPTLSKPNDITATITYSSSDTNVATIDNTGKVILKGKGSTTIKASLKDDDGYNDIDAIYQLIVKVPATIKFTNATASVLNTESYTQEAIVTPTGATVVYSPGNTNVSIDADGKVTPNNTYVGKVTITATVTAVPDATPQYYYVLADDDHFKASYELTVSKAFNNITFANGASYATFCNTEVDDLTKPEGITVYAVKIPTGGDEVTLSEINFIPGTQNSTKPEYTAVLLKRDNTLRTDFGTVTKYVRQSGDIIPSNENNDLVYTPSDLLTNGKQYILYKNEFVKATGTIPASKCYLESTTVNPARGFVIGDDNDGSTAIESIEQESSENEEWYDLQGRRIKKPTHAGIYIVNGQKVVIK